MARTFADGSANRVTLTNPSSSMFTTGSDWTALGFVRITDTDGDDRTLFGKHVGAGDRFSIRSDIGAAPRPLHVRVNGSRIAYSGNSIAEGTWYLVGCRQTGASNNMEAFVISLDLATVDIGANNGTNTWTGNSADLAIGNERASATASDEMDGRVAFCAYFTRKLTDNELRQYARSPLSIWTKYKADALFLLPLIGTSPEPDWSGNGHSGTISDSPGVGDMPPVMWQWPLAGRSATFTTTTTTRTGDLSATLAALASSAAGAVLVQGASSPTLGALTSTAAGAVDVQGSSTPTLGLLVQTATGVVLIQGATTATLGALTGAGAGGALTDACPIPVVGGAALLTVAVLAPAGGAGEIALLPAAPLGGAALLTALPLAIAGGAVAMTDLPMAPVGGAVSKGCG